MLLQFPIPMGQNYTLPDNKTIMIDSNFLEKLKQYVEELGVVFKHDKNEIKDIILKIKANIIGIANSVEVNHDFIFINVDILNENLLSLDNVEFSLYFLPNIYYPKYNNNSTSSEDYEILSIIAII